ncbi:MAG TPA: PKD domain-containing protein [Candidatus Limnocylindria bacterium]
MALVAGVSATARADTPASQSADAAPIEVIPADRHDVSPRLRDLAPAVRDRAAHREIPLLPTAASLNAGTSRDGSLQTSVLPNVATTQGPAFAGIGSGDYGFTPNAAPPDTNGAAGLTQYVQWVNESFAVFNKSTGALVYGPAAGNTLWSGFGGSCERDNDGDPIAQYDKAANRWVMTQFAVPKNGPYFQCVAVSTTSDATGTYARYAFQMPQFPDYPKLGVWPDAYYMSFNMFRGGRTFSGARACALDRGKMLAGAPAVAVCAQLSTSYGSLLPSDLDGATPPPAGSPDYYLNFGTNALNLWKFHVDFVTTANSTFTGPTTIPTATFSAACSGGTCIPQPGTSNKLDSLGDRLMYRLAYRNFGDHESLVVNHSVAAGTSTGVRWYELRNPRTGPTIYQQGTFAPDSAYRWMGSIAMDHVGDIAVGYSVSSSSIYPSIRYTGRVPTDALGTLEAENTLFVGTGSQTGTLHRWGDYSAMSVDPADDCTFWYTNEYLKASGSFNWSTRIGSFKFPGCDTPTVATPAVANPNPVTGTTTSLSVLGADDAGEASLTYTWSASGPAAVSFSANGTNAAKNTTASFSGAGSYTFTVTITDGASLTTTSGVAVTVN